MCREVICDAPQSTLRRTLSLTLPFTVTIDLEESKLHQPSRSMTNLKRNVIYLHHAEACKTKSVRQGSRKCELFFICHKMFQIHETFVCCGNGSAVQKEKFVMSLATQSR